MTVLISNGDFIKIEYTGKDKNGKVFDSTQGKEAKTLHGKEGPLLIVFGRDLLVSGLQDALSKLKKGEETDVEVPPEKAFGSRRKELIKIISEKELRKFDMVPTPGLNVELETDQGKMIGTIRSVNSGRVLIDFNHPLADQTVSYHLKVVDIATNPLNKIQFLLEEINLEGTVTIEKDKANIKVKKTEKLDEKKKQLTHAIKELISEVKEVTVTEES